MPVQVMLKETIILNIRRKMALTLNAAGNDLMLPVLEPKKSRGALFARLNRFMIDVDGWCGDI